jgi:murein DD-endopeptidase MepM/ murein hydrolase activator NlpD
LPLFLDSPQTLMPRNQPRPVGRTLLLLLLAAVVAGAVYLQRELRLPPPAVVAVTSDLPAIGRKTIVTVTAQEPRRGLSQLTVTASGAGFQRRVLAQVSPPTTDAGPHEQVVVVIPLGREVTPDIRPGTVTLEVVAQARGTRLRTPPPVVVRLTREVQLQPPTLAARSAFIHPAQGGAEVVVYDVGPGSKRDGVQVGRWFFSGFPLPGGSANQRFALFGIPYDLETSEAEAQARVLLVAEDELGNRAESQFIHRYFRRPMGKDAIELQDAFMKKVTEEVYARTPELRRTNDLLEDFLQLNRGLRQSNMAQLASLAASSRGKFLWSETFLPMPNAAVKGSFADRRTYLAAGKPVDTQDHLGFDLASLKQAPVQAANAGVVALSSYFGIFGNCVVLDHGYGLMSLYAHLSTLAVKVGDTVARGQELGRTGGTGLAGGDHLHFTMLVQGLPVTPVEWWDGHWIQDRLKLKLAGALPWQGTP